MKYFKKFNILALIVMVIFFNTAFTFTSQSSTINPLAAKTKSIKAPIITKSKVINKVVQKKSKTIKVKIEGFAFNLKDITINKGDTVVWTNLDSMAHTVTGSSFDSGNLDKNATFKYTFNTAGTFHYVCSYHANMTGSVTVK
jgi:plastocyanin